MTAESRTWHAAPGGAADPSSGRAIRPETEETMVSEAGADTGSLLGELARLDVKLRLTGEDRIEVSAPRGRLSPELRARIAGCKPELLASLKRVQNEGADPARLPVIVPDDAHLYEPFPPSDLQQSFLIGSREGFEYYVRPHQYMEFDFDELDVARFEQALNRAVGRQRKSLVRVREDMLLETVRDPEPLRVTVSDLRGLPEAEAHRRMERTRAVMRRQEPSHERWPWLEPHISRYGDGRARLHYNNNNIFTDAPSGVALITDALRYYHEPDLEPAEIEVSFRDCVLALAELEESPLGQQSKKYWCERIDDWPEAPALPLVSGTEHRGRSQLSRRELFLPEQLWAELKRRSEATGVTPTNLLLGAHAEVIAVFSGSRHFLLNNMISHRPLPLHPQMSEVLGNFAALYPLEVDWRPDEPFRGRVRRLQAQVLSDVAHAYWSGAKVLQTLNQRRRTPGRASCPFAVGSALFVGATDRPYYSMLETPQTLLDTEFWELRDGRLLVIWDVIEPMFPDGLIDAMLMGYQQLLHRLAEDPAAWEQRYFDLLPGAQARQRAELNRPAAPVPDGLLHDPLQPHAASAPDRPAVVGQQGVIDYAELHRRSLRIAELLRAGGVRPGDRVPVLLPKGADQVVAVHGALAAGAVYVPIDPAWPQERLCYLYADTAAAAVITNAALREETVGLAGVPVLAVDAPEAAVSATTVEPPCREPGDPAYVIYTSGSTGHPKGAILDHRGPRNTIADINTRFGITSEDVLLGVSSLCFDLSVYDIFGALAASATLVMPSGTQSDPAALIELVRTHGVTVWNSVPAVMQLVAEAAAGAGVRLPSLRTVLLSGDWIPVDLPGLIRQVAPQARIVSLGGATEASIWSIYHPIGEVNPRWASIPYGRPLANQSWYVLDRHGLDVPTWVTGELYIGGVGVALGYLGDPARTEAAFVTHPRTGERLYRTGDLGRYLPSGDIEFLGRADFQVKIQGYRVEPGEVEHALLTHPDVGKAAVVARQSGSGRQLVAFAVPAAKEIRPEPAELREFLAGRLPTHLVPGHLAVLDALPLTGNGKVDRSALERMGISGDQERHGHTPARTPVEAVLVEIWEAILDVSPVGVHDDFFDLGGQSFAALRVSGLIAERLGRRVPLGTMLERRTVAGLAGWLASSAEEWTPLTRLKPDGEAPSWFFVHPAGGTVLCYRALAEQLGRQFHAFQAPGPAGGRQALESVEDLAELYLPALLEVQPHGPYLLGGWSSGAVIAMELAHRLEQRGERVDRLVVIDAPAPLAPRPIDEAEPVLWFLEDLGTGFDAGLVDGDEVKRLSELPEEKRLGQGLELMRRQGVVDTRMDAVDLAATFTVFRGVVRACNGYRGARINADITVVRAERAVVSEFSEHPAAGAPDWGWSALTSGTAEAGVLPGTHHTLLTDPGTVAALAEVIAHR